MKYSIRGNLTLSDGTNVIQLLNTFTLWGLRQHQSDIFTFEAWVNTVEEKTSLFNQLKSFVTQSDESINWHICTHDETNPQPCIISEEYRG